MATPDQASYVTSRQRCDGFPSRPRGRHRRRQPGLAAAQGKYAQPGQRCLCPDRDRIIWLRFPGCPQQQIRAVSCRRGQRQGGLIGKVERPCRSPAALVEVGQRMMRPPGCRQPGDQLARMRVRLAHQVFARRHCDGQNQGNDGRARSEDRCHQNVGIARDAGHSHRSLPGDGSPGGVKKRQRYLGPVVHHVHCGQGRDSLVR